MPSIMILCKGIRLWGNPRSFFVKINVKTVVERETINFFLSGVFFPANMRYNRMDLGLYSHYNRYTKKKYLKHTFTGRKNSGNTAIAIFMILFLEVCKNELNTEQKKKERKI